MERSVELHTHTYRHTACEVAGERPPLGNNREAEKFQRGSRSMTSRTCVPTSSRFLFHLGSSWRLAAYWVRWSSTSPGAVDGDSPTSHTCTRRRFVAYRSRDKQTHDRGPRPLVWGCRWWMECIRLPVRMAPPPPMCPVYLLGYPFAVLM